MIAAATALVLLGGCILLFLNPIYVGFEQARTDVAELTGYSASDVDAVTGQILADLVLWRGGFDVQLDGAPVLKPPEIKHMLDVRGVFAGLYALVAAGALVLVVSFRRTRDAQARAAVWRAVSSGGRGLAIVIAVVGAFAVFTFDAAFEVFHRLFFAAGSYDFDPRTDKLVQLFPDAFWSETATIAGATIIVAAVLTWWIARQRAAGTVGAA